MPNWWEEEVSMQAPSGVSNINSQAGQDMRGLLDDPYANRYRNALGVPENFDPNRPMSAVETQYNEQFGRQARPEEVSYWQGQNIAPEQLAQTIGDSAGSQDRVFSRMQQGLSPVANMGSYSAPQSQATQNQKRQARELRRGMSKEERRASKRAEHDARRAADGKAPRAAKRSK
jgi:hypothetical protein